MKNRNLLLLSLVTVLTLGGCGSSSQSTKSSPLKEPIFTKVEKIKIPEVSDKIDRANWTNVQPIANGFFITDNDDILSFKLVDDRIRNHNYRTETIFIDADDNQNTGYINRHGHWGHIGAEYLISEGNLYRYGGLGWSWEFVGKINNRVMNGNELEIEFPKRMISTSENIRAVSGLADRNWSYTNRSGVVSYRQIGAIPDLVENGNFNISDTENSIIFTFESERIGRGEIQSEAIFVDADNNQNSGYTNPRWGNIGAEYLIEGDKVYRYGGNGWNWNLIGNAQTSTNANTISVTLNKDRVDLSNSVRVVSGLVDRTWNTVERYDLSSFDLNNGNDNTNNGEHRLIVMEMGDYLYFGLPGDGQLEPVTPGEPGLAISIDADNNNQTGFGNEGIEYSTGSRREGASRLQPSFHTALDFGFTQVGKNGVLISKSALSLNSTIRVGATGIPMETINIRGLNYQNGSNTSTVFAVSNAPGLDTQLFKFHSPLIASGEATHPIIFVNVDNNSNTGYSNNRWGWENIGAEFIIDEHHIYAHFGEDAPGWNWEPINENVTTTNEDGSLIIQIRNLFPNAVLMPALLNNNWQVVDRLNMIEGWITDDG